MVEIWHNPRCSKSRQTLALLEGKGIVPDVKEYLKSAPTQKRLREVLTLLGLKPREIMRKGEALYKELKLAEVDDEALIKAMVENPILIERPVVIKGNRAVLGRPPENVLALL